MKLGILTCLWRRPELSELMLRHTASLETDVRVAVATAYDPEPTPDVNGWVRIYRPNSPLSDKWNAGMEVMRLHDVDAVMILGSDDFVNQALIDRTISVMNEHGADYVQPGGLWVHDTSRGRCFYGAAQRIGAGRTLSRRLLDLLDWKPWVAANLGRVDSAMDERVRPFVVAPYRLLDMPARGDVLVDIKTETERSDRQAWTYDDLAGLARAQYQPEKFFRYYFPDIADDILNLRGVTHG